MRLDQLTIYGAGLIGGSIALAAKEHKLASHIVAIDLGVSPAKEASPFTDWVDARDEEEVKRCLQSSSLSILCVPVKAIMALCPFVLQHSKGPVTDCGSTKQAISESLKDHEARARFVPGHPMAGKPRGGLENARADLFQQRKWILCSEDCDAEALKLVREFVTALGADLIDLSARHHDESVAITSHVPQVVASALSVRAEEKNAHLAAGPGFASATRVAGGAEAMWGDIFKTNGHAIGDELIHLGRQLTALGQQLAASDAGGTLEVLEAARASRSDEE